MYNIIRQGDTDQNNILQYCCETREDVALICETWKDAEALKAHMATEEFKLYVGNMEKYATMKIEQFEF